MPKRSIVFALLAAFALIVANCGGEQQNPQVGEPLPDTFPVTGTASDLPEGMLPPAARDTLPR